MGIIKRPIGICLNKFPGSNWQETMDISNPTNVVSRIDLTIFERYLETASNSMHWRKQLTAQVVLPN